MRRMWPAGWTRSGKAVRTSCNYLPYNGAHLWPSFGLQVCLVIGGTQMSRRTSQKGCGCGGEARGSQMPTGRIPVPPQVGVGGCGVFDYIECAALIAAASVPCVVTRSPGLCFQAVGAAIAVGCWDCLPSSVQEVACLLCRQQPLVCPQAIRIRCAVGGADGESASGSGRQNRRSRRRRKASAR